MVGCIVTIEGEYFALASDDGRKKIKRPYKIEARVKSPDGALSLIRNKLLNKILTKKYEDYHTFRTHQISKITDLNGEALIGYTNVRLMDFNQIANHVRLHKLPLKLELYTDLGTLRSMVFLAETNVKEFHIKQGQLAKEAAEDAVLAELNPDLFDGAEIKTPESGVLDIEPAPPAQKVEQVWVKGRGFVPIDDFEEDCNRPDEAPYEDNLDDEVATTQGKPVNYEEQGASFPAEQRPDYNRQVKYTTVNARTITEGEQPYDPAKEEPSLNQQPSLAKKLVDEL